MLRCDWSETDFSGPLDKKWLYRSEYMIFVGGISVGYVFCDTLHMFFNRNLSVDFLMGFHHIGFIMFYPFFILTPMGIYLLQFTVFAFLVFFKFELFIIFRTRMVDFFYFYRNLYSFFAYLSHVGYGWTQFWATLPHNWSSFFYRIFSGTCFTLSILYLLVRFEL